MRCWPITSGFLDRYRLCRVHSDVTLYFTLLESGIFQWSDLMRNGVDSTHDYEWQTGSRLAGQGENRELSQATRAEWENSEQ
jgi:hypothetical protein